MPDISAPQIDMPDVEVPEVGVPDVAMPAVAAPSVDTPSTALDLPKMDDLEQPATVSATVTDSTPKGEPIERLDAWRKPAMGETIRAETDPSTSPGVVDLAIRDEIQDASAPEAESKGSRMALGAIAALALIGLIAWLLFQLFSGNSTTETASTTTTSEVVEEATTDAPTTSEAVDEAAAVTDDTEAEPSDDATPTTQEASVFDLRAGDCIVGDIGAGQVTRVEKVDCELEHQFEVYREALIESSITEFNEIAISAYAEDVCRTSLAAYIPSDDERNLRFKFLQPTEDSWNQADDPDRVVTCLLFDGDGDPLIGRAN